MTKIELIAATLARMCQEHEYECLYPGDCPFSKLCKNVVPEDWILLMKEDSSIPSIINNINDIYARLQKIESKLEGMEAPDSLAAFVKRKIKEAAHR
jgi:hypothetical protein